jgi:hypothetical protein
MVLPMASQAISYTQMTAEGTAWFDCEDSWASIHDSSGSEVGNGSDYTVLLNAENHTFEIPEVGNCQGVIPVSEEMPNLRPSPTEIFPTMNPQICPQDGQWFSCEGQYVSGDLIEDSTDVFAINVSEGQILVLMLVASSASIDVALHFQNTTHETELDQGFMLSVNTSIGESNFQHVPIDEDGRIIVSVTSPSPDTIWAIRSQVFDMSTNQPLTHLDNIVGIGASPFYYPLGEDESLVITKSVTSDGSEEVSMMYRYIYSENSSSEWYNATLDDRIKGIADMDYIEFKWDCECQWMASMSRYRHFDAGWGMDAPSMKPMTSTSDNSTYPLITMDGHSEDGELTLHMGDYRDILRVETTGWNESIHLVDVIIEGDIYDLEVTIWDIDQRTWNTLDEITATYSMNQISASIEVGRGTHFIRIQHINGSDSVNDNAESVDWKIRVTTAVLDEGEEPWFPASQNVKDAASIFYWLIGFVLIAPFIIFYIVVQRDKQFALEFASRKNRLEWLSTKLDKGEFRPGDLTRALRAVSSLDWEDSLEVWGEPTLRHLTMGVDMAIWSLDRRITESDEWPLLIGLQSRDAEWSIAALRFEAPEGELWNIKKVEPKMLLRDNEVFLDSIYKDSRLFIQVTLGGKGDALDIHLSGIVSGEPMASKPARTIYRSAIDSEE